MQIRNIAQTVIFGVKYLTPPTFNDGLALTFKGANHHLLISVQIGGQRHSSLGDARLFKTGVVKSFTRNIDIWALCARNAPTLFPYQPSALEQKTLSDAISEETRQ